MMRLIQRAGQLACAVAVFSAADSSAGEETNVPSRSGGAILFAGYPHFSCGFEMAGKLQKDGFAVSAMAHPGLEGPALTWDRVRR